jgi:hypothetical protein
MEFMRYIKTTWNDYKNSEKKIHLRFDGDSNRSRAYDIIECPFCKTDAFAYLWSITVRGKRCEICGAMHTDSNESFRKAQSIRQNETDRNN